MSKDVADGDTMDTSGPTRKRKSVNSAPGLTRPPGWKKPVSKGSSNSPGAYAGLPAIVSDRPVRSRVILLITFFLIQSCLFTFLSSNGYENCYA